jgi:hypothetical protein
MLRVSETNLIPGKKYTVRYSEQGTPTTGVFNSVLTSPYNPDLKTFKFRGSQPTTYHLGTHPGSELYEKVNDAIVSREGGLGKEYGEFRRRLISEFGPKEAARMLADPTILKKLAMQRRGPLLSHLNIPVKTNTNNTSRSGGSRKMDRVLKRRKRQTRRRN